MSLHFPNAKVQHWAWPQDDQQENVIVELTSVYQDQTRPSQTVLCSGFVSSSSFCLHIPVDDIKTLDKCKSGLYDMAEEASTVWLDDCIM